VRELSRLTVRGATREFGDQHRGEGQRNVAPLAEGHSNGLRRFWVAFVKVEGI
jgi:hypothetical protein